MRCSCGHENEPGRQFCGGCGAPLGQRGHAWWVWLLVFLGIVVLVVIEHGIKQLRDQGEPVPTAHDAGR
jgi:hypothetical protein